MGSKMGLKKHFFCTFSHFKHVLQFFIYKKLKKIYQSGVHNVSIALILFDQPQNVDFEKVKQDLKFFG
jgi:hypothetical protein